MASTTIRRIPTADAVSGPASMRPSGSNPAIDVSAPFEGAQALAAGAQDLATGVGNFGKVVEARERTADVTAADADWLQGSNDIGSTYQNRGDYQNFEKGVTGDTQALLEKAASKIRDPETRQAWMDQTQLKKIALISAVKDHGTMLSHDNDRSMLSTSIEGLAKLYADPGTPQVVRDDARKSIDASIATAQGSGLVTPGEAAKLRSVGIEAADQNLALNRARLGLLQDPQKVLSGLAIPSASDTQAHQGILTATTAANGGKLPDLDYSLAKVTADLIGDANFPTDPKLARAYLADPAMAQKYSTAAAGMLNDRYKGNLSAVAIALDPKGGTVMADQFVKSGNKPDSLPKEIADRLKATMQNFRPAVGGERIPIQAAPGVDLNNSDPAVLDRFEQLQSGFGEVLPLISAHRDGEHNKAVGGADHSQHLDGRALDIDVSSLSVERRAALIQAASAAGFTGIGVYNNSMHLDTGPLRAWGSNQHSDTVPAWAKDAIAAHLAGTATPAPMSVGVAPDYAALSFDQRLQLAGEARQAVKAGHVDQQASLETIATNAPAAIASTGKYDGDLPTATSFVQAYGAVDGIQKFRAFTAAVDVSKTIFGFRAESSTDILAQVAAATPTSSGNDADVEAKRFDAISAAAEQTIKARNADPAGYVMSVFPNVQTAFEAAQKDPSKFGEALGLMQTAQEQLGVDTPQLLPKAMATQAATTFNDTTLPAADRMGAVAQLMLRTSDEKQQRAIYSQLLGAGVPEYTQGAVAAMIRGDAGGAQNLMRAVMIDPEKIAGTLPSSIKPADIDAAIQSRIFDTNQIGDAIYGITDGGTDALARLRADSTLISRDVRLHLIDGSAAGDLNKAIDLTVKDMYGDVQLVTGGGVKVTIPKGDDPAVFRQGLESKKASVADALHADMQNGMIQVMGKDVDFLHAGMSEVIKQGIENAVGQVMDNGYFVNAGDDHYQFFNPYTGAVVGDKDGKPMLFSRADLVSVGAANAAAGAGQQFPGMGGR